MQAHFSHPYMSKINKFTGDYKPFHLITLCALCSILFIIYLLYKDASLQSTDNIHLRKDTVSVDPSSECKLSYGHYDGPLWSKDMETLSRICLLESNRMRVDYHARQLPDKSVINDWLWVEYGDRVNVLVREKGLHEEDGKFVVFEQTKYALEGSSLAVVGGFIEKGETPEHAALREVKEELQLSCDIRNMKALGRYRTDVNRGVGWVNTFLVQGCVGDTDTERDAVLVADADSKQEAQSIQRLTLRELEEAVTEGRFVEVQWTAAAALALLYLKGS